MNYSIHDIKTIEECDTLLKRAGDRKTDIEIRSYKKGKSYKSKLMKVLSTEERIKEVMEEISSFEIAVSRLPEGQLKEDIQHRLVRLNHKKYMLGHAKKKNTWPGIIRHEYQINALKGMETAVDDLIEGVKFRKSLIE